MSSSNSASGSISGSRFSGFLLRLALSSRAYMGSGSSDADEPQRHRHTIREGTWRAHQLSKPEPSSGGGLLRDPVRIRARRGAAFHAANQLHGKVGRDSSGSKVPASLPAEATRPGRDGKEDAERKSRTLPQDPSVPGKAE